MRKGRGRRAEEEEAAGVTVKLARTVRLGGDSRPANRRGYNIKTNVVVPQRD